MLYLRPDSGGEPAPGAGTAARGSRWGGAAAPPGAAGAAERKYYVLATVAGLDMALLNIFLQSWRRYSPRTQLVLFVDEGAGLHDFGVPAEVVPFRPPDDPKLVKLQR